MVRSSGTALLHRLVSNSKRSYFPACRKHQARQADIDSFLSTIKALLMLADAAHAVKCYYHFVNAEIQNSQCDVRYT
ncbi:MAG: hypothetical protein ACLTJG_21885, partial [[Clostridium] innocuum]